MSEENEFQAALAAYRTSLEQLEQKAQAGYDKAVMTLSGGALALSMSFVKEISRTTPLNNSACLLVAWACWGLSVTATLFSFLFSQMALRKAIRQVDDKTIYLHNPGGWTDRITATLNISGGLLFVFGLAFLIVFVSHNLH